MFRALTLCMVLYEAPGINIEQNCRQHITPIMGELDSTIESGKYDTATAEQAQRDQGEYSM